MIKASNLGKSYIVKKKKHFLRTEKEVVQAVHNLHLSIKEGEIVGLLGLNGAGKTTTIKMLSTLLSPSEGNISIDGLDVVNDAMKVKSLVNMIAGGERMLYWRLTGLQNLRYFGKLYGLKGELLEKRISRLLEEVGLTTAADTPVELYSKGMKQRLQIARGLINDPKYLFLDEPTLGLDVPVAKQLRGMVKKLAKEEGKGILLTSHYLEEVEELCDRVYIIEKGSLLLHDTPENIISTVVKNFHLKLVTSALSLSQIQNMNQNISNCVIQFSEQIESMTIEVIADYDPTSKVLNECMKEKISIHSLEMKRPRLEDAILTLAKGSLL